MDNVNPLANQTFELVQLATTVNGCHHRVLKAAYEMLSSAKEAGIAFHQAKAQVGHGHFQTWIANNFEGSLSTANLYMRIFENWGRIEKQFGLQPRISIDEARAFISFVKKSAKTNDIPDHPEMIRRDQLLRELESVQLGLDASDGYCLFRGGRVFTSSGGVSCACPCHLKIEGAVHGKLLIAAVKAMDGDYIRVGAPKDGLLELTQVGRKVELYVDTDHGLMDSELPSSLGWLPLPDNFAEAVRHIVAVTASGSDADQILRSVHINGSWMTASDNYRVSRHRLVPPVNISIVLDKDILATVAAKEPIEAAATTDRVYFRNNEDLVISCIRPTSDAYPQFAKLFALDGTPLRISPETKQAAAKVHAFIVAYPPVIEEDCRLRVFLEEGVIKLTGTTLLGTFTETVPGEYCGPRIGFEIEKSWLLWAIGITRDVYITKEHMVGRSDDVEFCVCLGSARQEEVSESNDDE